MDSKVSSLSQTFPLNFMESDEFPSQCHSPTMSVNQEQKMLIFKVSSAAGQKYPIREINKNEFSIRAVQDELDILFLYKESFARWSNFRFRR